MMKYYSTPKPKDRSAFRLAMGKAYFRFRRRIYWWFGGRFGKIHFAGIAANAESINTEHFAHQTPLLRQLKDVDMYLQHNKIINLRLALQRVNGVVVKPGETFSYWRLIGKPTARKGYVSGMVLDKGKVTVGIGGGLCQLSNLIYWLTLHTPLTVAERHRHSFDVFPDSGRTQPFGSGATCFYNYIDLMIKNETDMPFKLVLEVADGEELLLKGSWLSVKPPEYRYEVYEKSHMIKSHFWGGYTRHNTIHRRVFDAEGIEVGDEFITENHAIMMYEPLLEARDDK